MATFTTTLGEIVEDEGSSWFRNGDGLQVVENWAVLGLDRYPIHREEHRETLNALIFMEYQHSEIAHETYSIWLTRMYAHMALNMPVFNAMYAADDKIIDPLNTMNINNESNLSGTQETDSTSKSDTESTGNTEDTRSSSTTSESSATGVNKSRAVNSDTPQSALSGNKDYATAAVDTTSTSETENTGSGSDTGTAEQTRNDITNVVGESNDSTTQTQHTTSSTIGYQGLGAELIARHKRAIMNTDRLVIESLKPLFMILQDAPNEHFHHNY